MRKKGGKWPHLLSWKLASSENVFGARGWPVNGVNANEHNEGRGSANVPINSIRWSTTGSRLFFKPPSSSLPLSNSPHQQSLFGEGISEGVLGFCLEKGFLRGFWVFVLFCLKLLFVSLLMFSFRVALNLNSSSPVKCGSLSCFCTAWPRVMILNFPKAFIWTSHLTGIKGKVFAITTSSEVPKS